MNLHIAPVTEKSLLAKAAMEKAARLHHARVSQKLLDASPQESLRLVSLAKSELERMASSKAFDPGILIQWKELLDLPVSDLALKMVSDMNGQGTALRLSSPWKDALK